MKEIISRLVDGSCFSEYKKDYGKTMICGHASIGGYKVGIIANQREHIKTDNAGIQLGGVIYSDSADKAAKAWGSAAKEAASSQYDVEEASKIIADAIVDSIINQQQISQYGVFANAAMGVEKESFLENRKYKLNQEYENLFVEYQMVFTICP